MPSFDAILRVRAKAEGQRELQDLDRRLRGLGPAADSGAAGVGRMSRMLETMGGVAAGIGLSNLAGRMTDFGREAIIAGDESLLVTRRIQNLGSANGETARLFDFASKAAEEFTLSQTTAEKSVADLYGRLRPMGLSLSEIQTTFSGVAKASRAAGLSLLDQKEAFRQLAQAMGSGRLQGDEFRSLMERMPSIGDAIVKVFNDIATSKGIQQITKDRADQIIAEVRDGEKKQTEELRRGIEDRKAAAKDETDKQVAEVQRRYDRIRQIEGDRNEDADRAARRAADKRLSAEEEEITKRFDRERALSERRYSDARDEFLEQNQHLSEESLKQIERNSQDERDLYLDALQKRQDEELDALRLKHEEEATMQERALRDQRQQREQELQQQQQSEEKVLQDGLDKQKQQLDIELQTRIDGNKKANEQIIADVLSSVKVTRGELKQMAADGLITPEIMAKALAELDKQKIPDPTPLQVLGKAIGDLSREIGNNLNPVMIPLASGVESLVKGFISLPGPVKAAAVGLGLFATGVLAVGGLALFGKQVWDVVSGLRAMSSAAKAATAVKDISNLGRTSLNPFQVKQLPTVQAPRPGLFNGLLKEIGTVARALGGLTLEVGRFAGKFIIEAIPAVGRLGSTLAGLKIGATIAGWAGAVGPVVGGITAALGGLLAWMTGTFVPAMVAFFSGPVGWVVLGVAALAIAIYAFREPIMEFVTWAMDEIGKFWNKLVDWVYEEKIKPWVDLWNNHLKKPITDFVSDIKKKFEDAWKAIVNFANTDFSKKWADVWTALQKAPENVKNNVTKWFTDAANTISNYWGLVAGGLQRTWDNVTTYMGNGWRLMMGGVRKVLNDIIGLWNSVADKTQGLPGFARIPRINPIPEPPTVPGFAKGGYVDRPTLGLIGENPRNPREYVIPEGGMDRAAAGWQAGLRGEALVNAWQSPGLSPGSSMSPSTVGATGGLAAMGDVSVSTGPIQISVTGGSVTLPDGRQMVSLQQAQEIAMAAVRAAAPAIVTASAQASAKVLASAAGRAALGIS